jgi:hypothetical protein
VPHDICTRPTRNVSGGNFKLLVKRDAIEYQSGGGDSRLA